ncbi:MAG TPA: Rieske 2Fe-2S domain-containing protein [Candidatus Acidoferrales bacterium]|nr:Rieske 2Fe-2S domain-containing protein [Candidatus Acidoferrales bacterium]
MATEAQGAANKAGRRHFLEAFLGAGIVASLVAFLYPVLRYVLPPAVVELLANTVVAAHVGDLKPNTGKIFAFDNRPALLILTDDGKLHAISAVCTHLGCTVQYRPDLRAVWCACHNGMYTVDGKNISGPPPRPLEEYEVMLKDKEIYVQREGNG